MCYSIDEVVDSSKAFILEKLNSCLEENDISSYLQEDMWILSSIRISLDVDFTFSALRDASSYQDFKVNCELFSRDPDASIRNLLKYVVLNCRDVSISDLADFVYERGHELDRFDVRNIFNVHSVFAFFLDNVVIPKITAEEAFQFLNKP